MGLITTALPNLVQGVSQQPDAIRFDGQCSEQTNAISSVVDGLQKRPNTSFVARLLQEALDADTFVHFINRSDTEKYVVFITPNTESESEPDEDGNILVAETDASKLRIFNVETGEECTVNGNTGGYTLTGNTLSFNQPSRVLKALTVADSTFLLNTTTAVQPKGEQIQIPTGETDIDGNIVTDADGNPLTESGFEVATTTELDKQATISIDQGAYNKDYTVEAELFVSAEGVDTTTEDETAELPSISFKLEPFVRKSEVDSHRIGKGWSTGTKVTGSRKYYGHKVTDVVFGYKGARLKGPIKMKFTSTKGILRQPQIQLVMESYVEEGGEQYLRLGNIIVHDGGSFKGSGSRRETVGSGSSSYHRYHYGETKPDVRGSVVGGTATEVVSDGEKTATFQSGNSKVTDAAPDNFNANSDVIAGGLHELMFPEGGENFGSFFNQHMETSGSNIYISLKNVYEANNDFSITTQDSLSGTGLSVAYKEVDSIANLPVQNKNGFRVKIRGDAEVGSDDYYVKFVTNSGAPYGEGSYIESVGFGQELGVDTATMPQELVSISPNQFILRNMEVEDKLVGDDETNPLPSFVGKPISNIFFYKGRLGLLSGSNVVLSEAGFGLKSEDSGNMVYNFGRTSVTQLLDSDPIDVEVAASKVTNLRSAIGFQEDLVLFSENNQFILKGDEILTPKTVSINPVTNFDFDDTVDPISVGSFVLFPFERTGFTGVKQLEKTGTNDTFSSTEITEHVPHYIPSGIKIMAGSTAENFIAVVTEGEPECIYCYRYFYSGNNKVMSSWFKFEFDGEIIGLNFSDSILSLVQARNNETLLLTMPVSSGITDPSYDDVNVYEHTTLLDCRQYGRVLQGENTVKFPDSDGNITQTNLPYSPLENELEVYTLDGTRLNATNTTTGVVSLPLNLDEDTDVYVGIPYKMTYTFSEVLFKAAAGKGKTPTDFNKMQVRHGVVFFHDTQSFRVKVTPQYRKTYNNDYVPYNVGSSVIGELALSDGAFRFPVMSSAKDTTITIENDTALPSNFSAAEFESFVHGRSNRYAQ